jgi:hypothetical protein
MGAFQLPGGDGTGPSLSSATPAAVGTAAAGSGTAASKDDHVHAHGNQAASSSMHAAAVAAGTSGFMTGADKTKLDGIDAGADVTLTELAALAGEAGDVLTRAGDGVAPTWEPPAGGGIRGRSDTWWWSGNNQLQENATDVFTYPVYGGFSATSTSQPWAPKRASSITGITFLGGQDATISAGSLTLKIFIDGSVVAGCELVATTGQRAHATFAPGTYPITPTQKMDPKFSSSADYAGPEVGSWAVEFTEDEE